MITESKVLVEASGRPYNESAVARFTSQIHRLMVSLDQNVELSEVNFARINYKLTWSGYPGDIHKITNIKRTLKRIIGKYFFNWKYSIKIVMKESGDGV